MNYKKQIPCFRYELKVQKQWYTECGGNGKLSQSRECFEHSTRVLNFFVLILGKGRKRKIEKHLCKGRHE